MTDYTIVNSGKVTGGAGIDRLTYVYNGTSSLGVTLNFPIGSYDTGYSGVFDGPGRNDGTFSGIETFTFIDRSNGNDRITAGDGHDVMKGGAGNDILDSRGGLDTVDGGTGIDIWGGDLSATSEDIVIDVNGDFTYLGSGWVRNVEGLQLLTGSGKDLITCHRSLAVDDIVNTGDNDDTIRLNLGGADSVGGGTGRDTLSLSVNRGTGVTAVDFFLSMTGGYYGLFAGANGHEVSFSDVERFRFSDFAGGDDTIHSGIFADMLYGGSGNDDLNGDGGKDWITGEEGRDVITGGRGDDGLKGGNGHDTFVYDHLRKEGTDTIEDYNYYFDRIQIAGGNFAELVIAKINATDVSVTLSTGTVIILENVHLADITADTFVFV